jgi:hypothetical protein
LGSQVTRKRRKSPTKLAKTLAVQGLSTFGAHLGFIFMITDQLSEEADLQKRFVNVNIIGGSLPQAGGAGGYSVVLDL